ncbi:MAG: MBL fold metallo-hydrolase [Alphaproteobacteria bacterium]|nr:MBL fold metallo-hydrolase [Alphaproteobacteria bacterium]MBU1516061.1 MBL fold metallo-hydrolase [Alphaproteobacteria bacterium]MBU2092724.1 MBL fold metallo-hydrolase [Alphaproteobacteria bacterium]MBU2153751.1 MBL fold metallo-hydrolase [Alphaproteobacteria bacterium]MBU2308379.1 MBL fold metallo-hydrolase [Alphaproteobacteria bacterium]
MPILRVFVAAYGLLFTALGVGFWFAPQRLARQFHLEALNDPGLATLRADFGGLFLTLAALCFAGAWTRRRAFPIAAAALLALAVVGRLIGWGATGTLGGQAQSLGVELSAIALLAIYARSLPATPGPRSWRGLLISGGVVVVVAGLAAAALLTPAVQQAVFTQAVKSQMGRNNAALMQDDALRVALCGTSAPLPSQRRAKACVMVIAGGKFYIVDTGPESTKTLMQWGLPLGRIGGVLLTHFHSDHIGDLGELNLQTWAQGRPAPLAVYGGPGVERVVAGFNEAYAQDQGYRTAHHTAAQMPPATWPMVGHPVAIAATGPAPRTAVVLDDGKLRITAIETNHAPVHPAYAYRFDYKGRSVVITGDTNNYLPLAEAARGADILVSEALNREMVATMEATARELKMPRIAHIMHDIPSYHIAPVEAAGLADKAGVKLLVLYHLIPAPDNFVLRQVFTRGLNGARHGQWDLGEDGSLYTLPLGSKDVRIGRIPEADRTPT